MKTFYTEQDISNMHSKGMVEIEIDDDTVLTDIAREKAIAVGLHINQVKRICDHGKKLETDISPTCIANKTLSLPHDSTISSYNESMLSPVSLSDRNVLDSKLINGIKSAVIAKLGNDIAMDNGLLEQIISTVLLLFNSKSQSNQLIDFLQNS